MTLSLVESKNKRNSLHLKQLLILFKIQIKLSQFKFKFKKQQ